MKRVTATGILRYTEDQDGFWLRVNLHRDFGAYYRALVPPILPIQGTRFLPHITVVRGGHDKPAKRHWKKYEGERVTFEYVPYIHVGYAYYWLEVFCKRLEDIRVELGLAPVSAFTKPPGGRVRCFHTTIGNRKHVPPALVRYKCCTGRH